MKAKNMMSSKGNLVPNQFIINDDDGNTFFQSYNSVIVKIDKNNNVFLDSNYWDYSRTTHKYRTFFLNETTDETRKKIKSGLYKLINLN